MLHQGQDSGTSSFYTKKFVQENDSMKIYFYAAGQYVPDHGAVMIVYAANKQELDELVASKAIFYDFRIILVLPDMQGDSIRKGHLLKPRYLTYDKGDMNELREVIRKIVSTGDGLFHQRRKEYLQSYSRDCPRGMDGTRKTDG